MLWFRKGIVHLLALLLLIALLGIASTAILDHSFSTPNRLETWLSDSKIYNQVIPRALNGLQVTTSEGTVPLNNPAVEKVANQVFSPSLLETYANNFLNGNYAWLKGKTAIPLFTIDLSGPRMNFANQIGQLVESHLIGLPVCSDSQLAQLQTGFNPLTVACRPASLDAATAGQQLTDAIDSSNAFLNKPVITADNLDHSSQPYYKQSPRAPKAFQFVLKLPSILAGVAIILAIGIVVIAPTRRKGCRRIGAVFLVAGLILLIYALVADKVVNRIESKTFTRTLDAQLAQPYHSLLEQIKSTLVKGDVWFGAAYVALALIIFIILIMFRRRRQHTPQPGKAPAEPNTDDTDMDTNKQPSDFPTNAPRGVASGYNKSPLQAGDIKLTPRRRLLNLRGPSVSRTRPPAATAPDMPTAKPTKPSRPKRPGGLIQ